MNSRDPSDWVLHAGALGDCILIWPLLRALVRQGRPLTLAMPHSIGTLTRRWLFPAAHPNLRADLASEELASDRIALVDGSSAWLSSLWADPASRGPGSRSVADVGRVFNFVATDGDKSCGRWRANARHMFPGAEIVDIGPPASASRDMFWQRERVAELGGFVSVVSQQRPRTDIVAHVGAGGERKRWPMPRWAQLVDTLRTQTLNPVHVIAGAVEAERMHADGRAIFTQMGGRFIPTLEELAHLLFSAKLYIGADTGPTHLAAQLGTPTLALFGPTDPDVWRPVGPSVRVLAPAHPEPMEWLTPARVLDGCSKCFTTAGAN